MKLYAPKYYKEFKCIADKCTHSCCVGWEIDIDEDTLELYCGSNDGYGKDINESISYDGTPHFRLLSDERCPHLDEKGLCRIISNEGEEYMCDICREHPRFYNDSVLGREVGLGMACEEACRIILNSDDYGAFAEIGEACGEADTEAFDTVSIRERIYAILSDTSLLYNDKLRRIYSEYDVSPSAVSDDEWRKVLSSLEYLDNAHKKMFLCYSSELFAFPESERALERALAYFIYRHCTEARTVREYRTSLGFCFFCERLLASVIKEANASTLPHIVTLARIISEEIEYSEDNTESIKNVFLS